MTPYLIFLGGVSIGVIIGFIVASLCHMAHDADELVDDAERWERLKQGMEGE